MNDSREHWIRGTGRVVRDAWLMFGSVLLVLGVLELAYRGQSDLRSALRSLQRPAGSVRQPYADSAWYPAFAREYVATFHEHWKPFVYFRRGPFSGSMINVDSLGHRRTIGGAPVPGATDTTRVFFFGGSTMWGTNLRDGATIASVAAQALAAAAPPGAAIQLTNFGESGYVFTQEVIELELQLRAGKVPDVVLFYDGMCDMTAAVQYGSAGTAQNESNRSREFELGRAVAGTENGAGSDLLAAGAIGSQMMQRVQFVQRLLAAVARPSAAPRSVEWLARDVARIYAANVDLVEALSRAYGFRVVYVWQPTLYSTTKTPTPFERALVAGAERGPLFGILRAMSRTTGPVLDSTMKARVGGRFIDETGLFAGDTSSVFADELGHTTEKAVPPIVAGFLAPLRQFADSARRSRGGGLGTAGRRKPARGATQN